MLRPRKTVLFLIAVILIVAGVGFTARPVEAVNSSNEKNDYKHCPNPPRPTKCQHYSKDYSYYGKDYHKPPEHRDCSKDYSYYGKDYYKPPEYGDCSKDYGYYGKDYYKPPEYGDCSKDYSYYGKDYQSPPWRSQYKTYSNTRTRYLYMRGGVWTLNP
jgi:hypothetical protein